MVYLSKAITESSCYTKLCSFLKQENITLQEKLNGVFYNSILLKEVALLV